MSKLFLDDVKYLAGGCLLRPEEGHRISKYLVIRNLEHASISFFRPDARMKE